VKISKFYISKLTSRKPQAFFPVMDLQKVCFQQRTNILFLPKFMTKSIFLCRDANQYDSPSSHRSASQPLCLLSI